MVEFSKNEYLGTWQREFQKEGKWNLAGPRDVSKVCNCRHKSSCRGQGQGSKGEAKMEDFRECWRARRAETGGPGGGPF